MALIKATAVGIMKRRLFVAAIEEEQGTDADGTLPSLFDLMTDEVPIPWSCRNEIDGVRMGKVFVLFHKIQRNSRLRVAMSKWVAAAEGVMVPAPHPNLCKHRCSGLISRGFHELRRWSFAAGVASPPHCLALSPPFRRTIFG